MEIKACLSSRPQNACNIWISSVTFWISRKVPFWSDLTAASMSWRSKLLTTSKSLYNLPYCSRFFESISLVKASKASTRAFPDSPLIPKILLNGSGFAWLNREYLGRFLEFPSVSVPQQLARPCSNNQMMTLWQRRFQVQLQARWKRLVGHRPWQQLMHRHTYEP